MASRCARLALAAFMTCTVLSWGSGTSAAPILRSVGECGITVPPIGEACLGGTQESLTRIEDSRTLSETGDGNSGTATFSTIADYGTLGVAMDAFATAAERSFASAIAIAQAEFSDIVTAKGPVDGMPVTVDFSLPVEGSLSAESSAGASASALLTVSWNFGAAPRCWVQADGTSGSGSCITDGSPIVGTFTLVTGVPSTITVRMRVEGSATATSRFGEDQFGRGQADFVHTLSAFFAVGDPDVSLLFASGHDYAGVVSVPEPSPMSLLAAAMLALLLPGLARRRFARQLPRAA